MASLYLVSQEDFAAALPKAASALRDELRARESGTAGDGSPEELRRLLARLKILEQEYRTGELPAPEVRPWEMTRTIAERWSTESELGCLLCEIEYFYVRRL